MKLNRRKLQKILLKELSSLKESELKRPMEGQSPTDPESMKDPEVLLELFQSIMESQGIIWDNQQKLLKLIQELQSKV